MKKNKKTFVVRALTAKGVPSKMRFTEAQWHFNSFAARDAADKRVVELEQLNPGKKFVVVEEA